MQTSFYYNTSRKGGMENELKIWEVSSMGYKYGHTHFKMRVCVCACVGLCLWCVCG